ncbi:MAG: metal-dependent transcriptional regulator [Treponema sp.]|jgi:Mn-dependent DtxR family transcriptional regulator|nr:metal-dependent transcriptional regulator [Treponema sp.]
MDKLSFTMESYLDAIFELTGGGEGVRLTDLAKKLSVTKSTANAAAASLAEKGLITNERYGRIRLTDIGIQEARQITEKHRIIRVFFAEILDLDEETADKDACAIEHVISDKAARAMRSLLARHLGM